MTYIKTTLKREITIDSIITIHYFEYMKDFVFHGESHDFWEFLYVDQGSVIVQAGENHFRMEAGDIIFHEPNEFHAIRSVGNSSPNLVVMSFTTDSPAINFFRKKTFTLNKSERTLVSCILNAARETLSTPLHLPSIEQVKIKPNVPFGSEQMILLYLELFLITLEQNYLQSDNSPKDRKRHFPLSAPVELPDTKAQRIEEIIQYMQFRICEQLDTNQICQHFSMSRSSLQKLFHKEKDCGPMEYFSQLKIQRAKAMIRNGSKNFTEIAGFLSYSSPQYFSKQFKKSTGMSPMEYASSVKGISQALKGDD